MLCVRREREAGVSVTADDLDNLRHALGIDLCSPRRAWGYRNYFVTTHDDQSFARLVAAGFARVRGTMNDGRDTVFSATPDGCRAVGMTAREIARMESTR